jgi:hypothetical protein
MNQISIPKPCHENWENMLPEEQGRYCLACSKTVIDFSGWEQQQILDYLQNKRGEKVCGRFNVSQLASQHLSKEILPVIINSRFSLLKKIAAIIFICFGVMSCKDVTAQKTTGAPVCAKPKTDTHQLMGDTIITPPVKNAAVDTPQIMGKIAIPPKTLKPQSDTTRHSSNYKRK